ncbi:MAG: histidine--tRNA ligase [Vampirovibrionales bacterium]|nr:histidine--tRNA ligase [Cyanobacteria bacterium HKST-UBA03]
MTKLSAPKGTHDLLPPDIALWQWAEAVMRDSFARANVHEIRTPLFEATELFKRGVGETTDIVNKEMYTFEDGGQRSMTLRPENTASVVRAYNQHGMDRWPKPVKLYYMGPMFRYERPQQGRQRQFHQVGLEVFGVDTAASDAESILLAWQLLQALGLKDLTLKINNMGMPEDRHRFRQGLRDHLKDQLGALCSDCQARYETNPLRMLDCKNPDCQAMYQKEPIHTYIRTDFSSPDAQAHFAEVLALLDAMAVPYTRDPMLVRGLDYYTKTVFEITSDNLGAQSAVCGGGRYNGLVKQLGGGNNDVPATGWAMGMERLLSLLEPPKPQGLDVYVVSDDIPTALQWVTQTRQAGFRADWDPTGRKALGKQLAQADKLGACVALLLGESERNSGQVTVKHLASGEQETLAAGEVLARLGQVLHHTRVCL